MVLLLAAGTSGLHAQPTIIYGLGVYTPGAVYGGQNLAGNQNLVSIDPANPSSASAPVVAITGLTPGQVLAAIEVRPYTGQLYGLGYDAATNGNNVQLYTLNPATGLATSVGGAFRLELAGNNSSNTSGIVPVVGFAFNARTDRIRVVAPNGNNYRLDPNTGTLVGTDTPLKYVANPAGVTLPPAPYIGAVAYTNSSIGLSAPTLYDFDDTNTNGILSIQGLPSPNDGQLTTVAPASFYITGSSQPGPYPLASPTANIDIDVFYDRPTRSNQAFLLEGRPGPGTIVTYASNLYSLNLATGRATLISNISGKVPYVIFNIAVATVMPLTWNGSVSTAWNVPANWTPSRVPTSADDVLIPGNTPRQPAVSDNEFALSVTLDGGASLTTADGGTLNVSSNFINNNGTVLGSGSGTLALVDTLRHEIAGPSLSAFQNLVLGGTLNGRSGGRTFTTGPVSVQSGLSLIGNLAIGPNQPFTLLSNASGTAYVVNSGGVATGTATVQRYITPTNPGLGYRHYSAPVSNTTVGDLATSTFTPVFNASYNTSSTPGTVRPYPTVYGYSQAQYESSPASAATPDFDKGYYSPADGTAPWVPGTGYTVNLGGNELVDFNGTLTNGDISTAGQGRSAKANAGWQLLGNPYPSSLDWDQVVATGGLVNIRNAVYVFKSNSQYGGIYASYINGQSTNGGTNVIPVAQGFFVQTSAVGATGNINFKNTQRITTGVTAPFQRTAADARPQLLLELSNGQTASQTDIYFQNGATAGFDNAYDATALPFLNGLLLATEAGTDVLAINGQPALAGSVTIPLQVGVAAAGTYSLRAATLANLPTGYHAYLRDAILNTYTDLSLTPSLTLSLTAAPSVGRFAILFSPTAPLATAPAALAALALLYPNPAHGTATLLLPQALRGAGSCSVQLVNALGQTVFTRTVVAGSPDTFELPLAGVAAGVYTVRATTTSGQITKRLVVE
ncbi:DUF4394 domain-containing protein [Hymenobacter sp. BRD67]|uniref:DUF4394 domain-containing protein n=1 Tax=Hymenobacter sp. BRD67 TaxID=2675877 RepID=UPI0015636C00|nr:DUF4394 domain-containing protein [Hymenobacter sp. BRD67]QKG52693.1 DUF4394 domain-containing protein [Hymenobacter sp. BRD67]